MDLKRACQNHELGFEDFRIGDIHDNAVLRIAQVAPLWTAVPPREYGGAELMVHWLTEELVREGHDVTLFASGDSKTSARLQAVCPVNLIDLMKDSAAYQYEPYVAANFAAALRQADDFDIIHSHVGAAMIPYGSLSPTPVLHTVHAGLDAVDEQWILQQHPEAPVAAISDSQVAMTPAARRSSIRTIYHGCDFDTYELSTAPGKYLAFIGRMGPHKNPVGAIKIAHALDLPIVLAGLPQDAGERKYFERKVRPLIDNEQVRYIGAISHQEKVELFKHAQALVFPIQWDEHFGLVMIEAMACGTPVVGCKRGSVPEVVDPGITGYYADTEVELVPLVTAALELDRQRVWEQARSRFSHQRMTEEYVDMYRQLLAG